MRPNGALKRSDADAGWADYVRTAGSPRYSEMSALSFVGAKLLEVAIEFFLH